MCLPLLPRVRFDHPLLSILQLTQDMEAYMIMAMLTPMMAETVPQQWEAEEEEGEGLWWPMMMQWHDHVHAEEDWMHVDPSDDEPPELIISSDEDDEPEEEQEEAPIAPDAAISEIRGAVEGGSFATRYVLKYAGQEEEATEVSVGVYYVSGACIMHIRHTDLGREERYQCRLFRHDGTAFDGPVPPTSYDSMAELLFELGERLRNEPALADRFASE